MSTCASFKKRFALAGLSGAVAATARAFIWFYKSAGTLGSQFWGPGMILLGIALIAVAMIARLFFFNNARIQGGRVQ
jgi:hypothetical protein